MLDGGIVQMKNRKVIQRCIESVGGDCDAVESEKS